ncbi:hypothetical protein GCM10010862_53160 [Devosia nitrariae]|uniref:Uncharacterized protein n=1 Tax=Devosia nitrariae TaxID=2071872 RepID=A0ABQ5WE01_9HYPH|nr:hypothetical protein GCM10010862_53160 [Devosia nitrariae]
MIIIRYDFGDTVTDDYCAPVEGEPGAKRKFLGGNELDRLVSRPVAPSKLKQSLRSKASLFQPIFQCCRTFGSIGPH